MSLLMDALKKAELAKRQGLGEGMPEAAEPSSGLSLEPLPPVLDVPSPVPAEPPAVERLPSLPTHLEELDAQFLASHTPAPKSPPVTQKPPPPADPEPVPEVRAPRPISPELKPAAAPPLRAPEAEPAAQVAAQNLFSAKQPEKAAPRKTFAIAIGVLTVLGVVGIGGYFWWQLQPKTSLALIKAPSTPLPPPTAATTTVPPTTPVPLATTPGPAPVAAVPITPAASSPAASPAAVIAAKKSDDDAEDKPAAAKPEKSPARAAPIPEPDGPVRVSRTPLRVNPVLMRAYEAFGRGDLAMAQTDYEKVLKLEPRNTDALHGLAAIAVRNGRQDRAEWLYQRILEADPQDSTALSALINAKGPADPVAAESRLKTLAAAQPDLSAPHFALGNLYARQARWEEAQQAYFRAYTAESDNPDILYNLAISLEHLRQNKLAIQYYGLALAAAQTKAAGFDKAQATARLRSLQP